MFYRIFWHTVSWNMLYLSWDTLLRKLLVQFFTFIKKVYGISLNFVSAMKYTYLFPNNQFLIEKKLSQTSESQVSIELPSSPLSLQNAISLPEDKIWMRTGYRWWELFAGQVGHSVLTKEDSLLQNPSVNDHRLDSVGVQWMELCDP